MEKTKKSSLSRAKEKIDQHDLMVAWSMGMNYPQIAKKLGVSLETVLAVKADLENESR